MEFYLDACSRLALSKGKITPHFNCGVGTPGGKVIENTNTSGSYPIPTSRKKNSIKLNRMQT